MALIDSFKGPDRVLFGLSALVQSKLPSVISAYNLKQKAAVLLTFDAGTVHFPEDNFLLKFSINTNTYSFNCGPSSSTSSQDFINSLNNADLPLKAVSFSDYGLFLVADSSFKILCNFENLKEGQMVNYQPLQLPKTYFITGKLPGEAELKSYPAVVFELTSITPEPDGILCSYGVDLTLGLTSPINTSQQDYLSSQLLKYYDCLQETLSGDDGSLGGLANGLIIDSASIDEATGSANFLKFLTISLSITVEED